MNFEIMENSGEIRFDVAPVDFPGYEEFKAKAADVANQINNMDVDPENIKEAKTTLAEARKITDRLSRARIDIKNAILERYTVFESQVKEISAIIGDAEDALRAKVREMEEAEKRMKKELIREIWEKRVSGYPDIVEFIPGAFDRWFKPQFINKTMTMKKVEENMTEWLRKTDQEMASATAVSHECFIQYVTCGDLTKAIEGSKLVEEIEEKILTREQEEPVETALFLVRGAKDITLTEMILKQNEIEFERK